MNAARLREIIVLQAFQTGDTAKAMAELIGAFHRACRCDSCGNSRTLHPSENFYECLPCRNRPAAKHLDAGERTK